MLKLRPRYRLQVPHGLAAIGALLLLASTVTGFGTALNSQSPENSAPMSFVASGEVEPAESADAGEAAIQPAPVKQKKRFRINLFLFRG